MSPQEAAKWTVEAVKEWAADIFASRDEAARIARKEAKELNEAARRTEEREVARLYERINREVQIRDERLAELAREMQRRLDEERTFREQVAREALTREDYLTQHQALVEKHDSEVALLDKRITQIERLLSNIQGRAVGFAVIGSLFLATATAIVTHLISGA